MVQPGPQLLLVEDDIDQQQTLVELLEHQGYRMKACTSAEEALTLLKSGYHPWSILLDLRLPGMSGVEFRRQLLADPVLKEIWVWILTGYPLSPKEIMDLQVTGYMLKPYNGLHLVQALDETTDLSPRETQVLQLVLEGKTNKQIACELSISIPTVKMHVGQILRKLGFEGRTELIAHFAQR